MSAGRLIVLALALLVSLPADARKDKKQEATSAEDAGKKRDRKAKQDAKAPAADPTCKEPAPKDPDLVAGLAAYGESRWADAVTSLSAFAAKPDAEKDPAVARGLYTLGYAARATGKTAVAEAATARAEPLLVAKLASAPTLEAAYYLQAIYQLRNDTSRQLAVISQALKDIDAGTLCTKPDADDMFRHARMLGFAGNRAGQMTLLRDVVKAYAATDAKSPYRAYAEYELGSDSLDRGDVPAAVEHLGQAARLDATLAGVHAAYGRALLQAGRLADAARWWRDNWRNERENGNGLIYGIPVIDTVLKLQPTVGDQGVRDIATYLVPSLETNAEHEAKAYLDLVEKRNTAAGDPAKFTAEDATALDVAHYRMAQFMVEYIARGGDLQEFALQHQLLPAIHSKDLKMR